MPDRASEKYYRRKSAPWDNDIIRNPSQPTRIPSGIWDSLVELFKPAQKPRETPPFVPRTDAGPRRLPGDYIGPTRQPQSVNNTIPQPKYGGWYREPDRFPSDLRIGPDPNRPSVGRSNMTPFELKNIWGDVTGANRTSQPAQSSTAPWSGWGSIARGVGNLYNKYMLPGRDKFVPEEEEIIVEEESQEDPRNIANNAKLETARKLGIDYQSYLDGNTVSVPQSRTSSQVKPARSAGIRQPKNPPALVPRQRESYNFAPDVDYFKGEYRPEVENDLSAGVFNEDDDVNITSEAYNSPAMDRYLAHLDTFPEYSPPGIWSKLGAALVGGMEGARSGAGSGFQAGRMALNAPYEDRLNRWGKQAASLGEAAEIENQSANTYLKIMEANSRMGRRDFQNQNDQARTEAYINNSIQRARMVDLREKEFRARGYEKLTDPETQQIVFFNKVTGDVIETGITSMEYLNYKQREGYQGAQIGMRRRALDQGKERIHQRWSTIEEGKRRDRRDNEGGY